MLPVTKDTNVRWSHAVGVVFAYFFLIVVCHIRLSGTLHNPAAGESRYLSKWLFWHHLSPLTGLLYISMMSCFTPCRVGWAQGDGFAQCRFKSNPIREHLHTQKTNIHKRHIWAAASSGFSCKLGLYSAADVFKWVILMAKTKQMLPRGRGKPAAMATFRNYMNSRVSTETSLVIWPFSPPQHICSLCPLPFASLPRWHWKNLLGLWGSLLFHALARGL